MAERNLYLTNLPVEEALGLFTKALEPYRKTDTETVEVIHSLGRVTAEAVYALKNSPLYDSAAMDGVAVVSARTKGAGESAPLTLRQGEDFIPVDTGDPVRPPYDAVIMAEDIQDAGEGAILIRAAAAPWQDIRPVGEDIVQGEMILPGGHKIRPMDVGVLLSGGITAIEARRRPEVAIIPTGTEMIEPGDEIREDSIIESNSRMLEGLVAQGGGVPVRFAPVPDEYDLIKGRLMEAAQRYDMVLICAGTSAGREDYTVHALRELGEVAVHGVAVKPGKPVILAVVSGKPVVGVPGYPVSAFLAYDNFAAPVLEAMTGLRKTSAPVVKAALTRRLVSSLKHREYVRVKVGRIGERLVASPLARGAGAAMSLVRADGFCIIGQDVEGLEAGSEVDVALYRGLDELEGALVSIGSHDLILDVVADLTPRRFPGINVSSTHVGSMGGLLALKSGEAHIAPTHLLDGETGEYNIPAIKELFAGRQMALIKGVGRIQGIMVAKGNPLGVSGIGDLPRCRYVNRQRGAGTRLLLDYRLKAEGIESSAIAGYEREAATHMAVAAAVASGSADAGLGVLSAAKAMELDFVPVGNEEYDFALPAEYLELEQVKAFIQILKSGEFRDKLEELGGYSAERCGEVILVGG
ncbi:MAG: molybdopterin biosynthesis protein [Clostridiales bacterium]|nr:molybdopterin biosynthesis protein [Clostridiales bacterium]